MRVRVNLRLGNLALAEGDYKAVARLAPRRAATAGMSGLLHLEHGKFAEAAALFRQARGRSAGREWRFQPALALLLAGDFTAASREYEVGLLRASDTDIDDALRDLSFWSRRIGAAKRARYRSAIAKTRARLRSIRAGH